MPLTLAPSPGSPSIIWNPKLGVDVNNSPLLGVGGKVIYGDPSTGESSDVSSGLTIAGRGRLGRYLYIKPGSQSVYDEQNRINSLINSEVNTPMPLGSVVSAKSSKDPLAALYNRISENDGSVTLGSGSAKRLASWINPVIPTTRVIQPERVIEQVGGGGVRTVVPATNVSGGGGGSRKATPITQIMTSSKVSSGLTSSINNLPKALSSGGYSSAFNGVSSAGSSTAKKVTNAITSPVSFLNKKLPFS